jgi:outer membrane protein assembly factor BamB
VADPEGWAAPTQVDDTLFASIDNGKMAALDAADDFSIKWIFPPDTEAGDKLELEAIYHAPIVTADTVYFGGYDGNVYALNAGDGSIRWTFETDGPIIGGLALADGIIFVGSDDGNLYALDPQDGSEKLPPFDTGDSIWAAPLATDSVLYVPSVNGKLYKLDAQTLEPVWERPFEADAGLLTDPMLADEDTLLVGGIDRRLYALNPETGAVKWSFKADSWFWGQPLVADGTIYVPNLDSHVYALDLDGNEVWAFETEAGVRATPLLAGDVLVVVDRKGNVYGLNPDTGTLKWSGPAVLGKTVLANPMFIEGDPNSIEDDEVLILAQGGDLFRLDPATGLSKPVEVR